MSHQLRVPNVTINCRVGLSRRELGTFMKNLVFSSVAFATIAAGPGMAADMTPFPAAAPAPAYSRTSMMARPYDWTGFYIGGHARYSRANSNSTTINTATGAVDVSGSGSTTNLHGGGQIGFDYTMPSRIVIGVLADVSTGEDHTTTFSNAAGTNVHTDEGKTDAAGTVRGRLGYGFDNVLIYGTGGWAWTNGTATRTQVVGKTGTATPGTVESGPANLNGWTLGAGLAFGFWHNWEVFGEYRYTSFQSNNVMYPLAQRSTTSTTTTNAIAGGLNFKFDPFIPRY